MAARKFLLVFLLLTGCGEPPFKKEMRNFREAVQQNVAASDLERWATNCIAKGEITEQEASEGIRKLMRESEVSVSKESNTSQRIVLFWYGNGFGHWGIAVGSQNYKCDVGKVQTHWTNGIWFWHE